VKTGECVGDVVLMPQAGDGSCDSIEYQLESAVQIAWYACQYSIAVVQSEQDERDDKRLIDRGRHRTSNTAQLTQNSEAASNSFLKVASHAEVDDSASKAKLPVRHLKLSPSNF